MLDQLGAVFIEGTLKWEIFIQMLAHNISYNYKARTPKAKHSLSRSVDIDSERGYQPKQAEKVKAVTASNNMYYPF